MAESDFWTEQAEIAFRELRLSFHKPTSDESGHERQFRVEQTLIWEALPEMVKHLDGKALAGLKDANKWLDNFKPGSEPDWEEARSAFTRNGPKFLEVLASFTELLRFESYIGRMISNGDPVSTLLLLRLTRKMKKNDAVKTSDEIEGPWESWTKSSTRDEIEEMLDASDMATSIKPNLKAILAADAAKPGTWGTSSSNGYDLARWLFEFVCQTKLCLPRDTEFRSYLDCYKVYIQSVYRRLTKDEWYAEADYKSKVRSLVYEIGCAKAHDKPEENIAELRLFHSTTIGYFATLQNQYLEKELEVKKLRHHISAIEFRHLLEHLPGPKRGVGAGPRWIEFCEKAFKDEATWFGKESPRKPEHALKTAIDEYNPDRARWNKTTKKWEQPVGVQNGLFYETGNLLFRTLSDDIHRYRGEQFEIWNDDGWSAVQTQFLRALKPLPDNINQETHEVDWEAERRRYVPDLQT